MKPNRPIRKLAFVFLFFNIAAFAQSPGSLDLTLNPLPGPASQLHAIVQQPDGKILIGGTFAAYNNQNQGRITRINNDGSLDTGFNAGVAADSGINAIALQPDGKIIIAGNFTTYNGVVRNRIARLNADGTLDTGFNSGTGANNTIYSVALLPDGKILIGGIFTTFNGIIKNRFSRLNSDGTLDNTFNVGTGADLGIHSIAVRPDGKILIGGLHTTYNGAASSFLTLLQPNGVVDTSFQAGTNVNSGVLSVVLQSDGKILIGGFFTAYNSIGRKYIARLNENGTLDTLFNPGTGANQIVRCLAVQSDNTILVGGQMTSFNGVSSGRIVALNANGSFNTNYNFGTGFDDNVFSILPLADGKILVGGNYGTYNGTTRPRLARLNGSSLGLDNIKKIQYSYYPNPVQNKLQVKSQTTLDLIEVYSMFGQRLAKYTVGATDAELDLSTLEAGPYLIRVFSGTDNSSFIAVKQ